MQHHLHAGGIDRAKTDARVVLTPALDDATQLADVLADRARTLAQDPATQALFLVGHGPNSAKDYAAWMANLRRVAKRVKAQTGFAHVAVDLVRDDAPAPVRAEAVRRVRDLIEMQAAITTRPVVVVPILISSGAVGTQRIRGDLADLPVVYTGDPILPHPAVGRWIEARVRDAVPSATAPPRATADHPCGS